MTQTSIRRRRWEAGLATMAVAAIVLLGACGLTGTAGKGPVATETRETRPFTRIEVSYGIGLAVKVGPAASIQVEAQGNLLPIIETQIDGTTLRIRGTAEFTSASAPLVVVTTPTLSGVALTGGSQGRIEGLANQAFDIDLGGGAGLTATGSSASLSIRGTGGSTAALDELSAGFVVVDLSGGTQAQIAASGDVNGAVSGGARVVVTGDAVLNVSASGGGEVSHD